MACRQNPEVPSYLRSSCFLPFLLLQRFAISICGGAEKKNLPDHKRGKRRELKEILIKEIIRVFFFVPSPVQKRTRSRQQHVVKMPSRSPGVPPQKTTSLLILSFVSLFVAASSSGHKGERETSAVRAANSLFFFRISNFSASREEEGWRWGLPPPVFLLLLLG